MSSGLSQEQSSSTASQYNRIVAERVLSLYDDLKENVVPVVLDADYMRRNLPGYYSWLQRNRTSNGSNSSHESTLIYPLSFGIPSQNIIIQVPPKNKTFSPHMLLLLFITYAITTFLVSFSLYFSLGEGLRSRRHRPRRKRCRWPMGRRSLLCQPRP